MEIYQVGGSVRDDLLGKRASDRDYVVIGSDDREFMERFPKAVRVGRRHCVYIVEGEEFTLSPETDIESDLALRDLTVNAMARDRQGRLYALPGSTRDLENRILRPVSLPNFLQDPLRVFRAARLLCCLNGFSAAPALLDTMQLASGENRLAGLSAERIGNEFLKAFSCSQPGRFLVLLQDAGALSDWLPEMAAARTIPAGPPEWHSESLFDHTCSVMNRLAGSALSVWMGLCHDLGKSATPVDELPHHYSHEIRGEKLAADLAGRLRLPGLFARAGAFAARYHMLAGRYTELRPGTRVDFLSQLHKAGVVDSFLDLVAADRKEDRRVNIKKDLAAILSVRLPESLRNQGPASGARLRELRCRALISAD